MAYQYEHTFFHDLSLSVSNTVFNLLKKKSYSFVLKEVKIADWRITSGLLEKFSIECRK